MVTFHLAFLTTPAIPLPWLFQKYDHLLSQGNKFTLKVERLTYGDGPLVLLLVASNDLKLRDIKLAVIFL